MAVPGTVALFQNLPCRAVELVRARGTQATFSTVVLDLAGFGVGWGLTVDPYAGPVPSDEGTALARLEGTAPPPAPTVTSLASVGELLCLERDRAGAIYRVRATLHVVRLTEALQAADGSLSQVTVVLADPRYLDDRGLLPRWSFNRRRAGGEAATDALRPDGKSWTFGDVVALVASHLHGGRRVSRVPDPESDGTVEVEPYPRAVEALEHLVRVRQLAEPVLDWGGALSLWRRGERRVQSEALPAALLLWLRGRGLSTTIEPGYPPEYAYVIGGKTIATAKISGWEPVLVTPLGRVRALTEETVRQLTKGLQGIEWLRTWILSPTSHHGTSGIPQDSLDLLAEQAWRMYRLPLVEVEDERAAPPENAQREDVVAEARTARPTKPGPLAHVLPLLPRAEAQGGGRFPVLVEGYHFEPQHVTIVQSARAEALATAREARGKLRDRIRLAATRSRRPDPWGAQVESAVQARFDPSSVQDLAPDPATGAALSDAVDQRRIFVNIAKLDAGLAADYEAAVRAEWKAAANSPTGDAMLDVAAEVLALEEKLTADRTLLSLGGLGKGDLEAERIRLAQEKIAELVKAVEEDRADETRTGEGQEPDPVTMLVHVNMPVGTDPGASVYDDDQGVVRLSRLPGWIEPRDAPIKGDEEAPFAVPVAAASAGRFVPRSVTVTFGTVVRPAKDVAWGKRGPLTGTGLRVPHAVTDEETFYRAVFQRRSDGVPVRVEASDLARRRALPLRHPELVLLSPLEGEGNLAALDAQADRLAAEAFAGPDRTEEQSKTVARPWPVELDGVVSVVTIRLRENARGFETEVQAGRQRVPAPYRAGTRVRQPQASPDAASREHLA